MENKIIIKLTEEQIALLNMGTVKQNGYMKTYELPHLFIDNEDGTFTMILKNQEEESKQFLSLEEYKAQDKFYKDTDKDIWEDPSILFR